MSEKLRVRFAPSPTGYLHIGGARTALFNYLFARREGGTFILRIEDTDRERSTPEAVQAILNGLRYLGITWDEGPEVGGPRGPYFQSERAGSYQKYIDRLLETGKAYRCFCTKERIAALREELRQKKERIHYDRKCLSLRPEEIEARLRDGESCVVRFRVPEGATTIDDMVRGEITFDHREIDDFVIQRPDGGCVYNFAVVGDDHEMGITHVIRGEDHITNTPNQILLFQGLGLPVPRYAHIPLILGPKRQKLSKRHGSVSVTEYREKGYLPEAMVNFLARIGWSYDDKQEIFSMEELVEKFSLGGVTRSGGVYDLEKLNHLGGHYMRQRPAEDVLDLAIPHWVRAGLVRENEVPGMRDRLLAIVTMEKDRIAFVAEIVERTRYYFEDVTALEPKAEKHLRKFPGTFDLLDRYRRALEESSWKSAQALEAEARRFAEEEGVPVAQLVHPLRAVLTGRSATPGMFEVMLALGQQTCLRRLEGARERFGHLGGGA